MSKKWRRPLLAELVIVVLAAGGLVVAFSNAIVGSSGGHAAADTISTDHQITVSGEGQISITPDTAIVSLGVTQSNPDLKTAQDAVNTAMDNIVTAIKAAGIPAKNIQTTGYNINANQDYKKPDHPITGYDVFAGISVTVQPLDKAGSIIDTAVQNGANQVGGISFTVQDPTAAAKQARAKAVDAARAKAQQLASLAGVTLGPIININETNGGPVVPYSTPAAAVASSSSSADTSVQPGQSTITIDLTVSFAIP